MQCFILLDITLNLRSVDRGKHFQIASKLRRCQKKWLGIVKRCQSFFIVLFSLSRSLESELNLCLRNNIIKVVVMFW